MADPVIPSTIPVDLARTIGLQKFEDVGSIWSIGLDGLGFMFSTLDVESPFEFRSYEQQSIPIQKPRIDDAEEPGEQTLSVFWARAQHSWHEGAGQDVFDGEFSSRYRFHSSFGMNPWTEGKITLLRETEELRNDNVDDHLLLATQDALFYTYDGNLKRDPDPFATGETDESVLSTHSGTEINSITSDGENLYAAYSGGSLGIKKTPLSGTLTWSDVNSLTDVDIIAYVKNRLIGAKDNSLYEFDLSSTTAPEPYETILPSGFRFTGITESGPAVYFSGGVGDRWEVFAARLTAQDIPFASTATLGAMRSVWQAPEGEKIHTIKGYIGQQVLIGTSKGVRVGTIVTGEGDLRVSALIVETPAPVQCFEPQQEFSWFGWTTWDGTYSGLGRMHLGDLTYASDLMHVSQGTVTDCAFYNDRMYFVTDEGATSRIIKTHASNLVEEGYLRNREIRFNTTEPKSLRYFDILTSGTGKWSLHVGTDGLAEAPYTTDNPAAGFDEEVVDLSGSSFDIRITLNRDDGDPALGPTLHQWRMRAEPKATGIFRYFVPVMVYDFIHTNGSVNVGYHGMAMSILNHLTSIYRNQSDVTFQGPEQGIQNAPNPVTVRMEELRFKAFAPPKGGKGFGGIALMILREVR